MNPADRSHSTASCQAEEQQLCSFLQVSQVPPTCTFMTALADSWRRLCRCCSFSTISWIWYPNDLPHLLLIMWQRLSFYKCTGKITLPSQYYHKKINCKGKRMYILTCILQILVSSSNDSLLPSSSIIPFIRSQYCAWSILPRRRNKEHGESMS